MQAAMSPASRPVELDVAPDPIVNSGVCCCSIFDFRLSLPLVPLVALFAGFRLSRGWHDHLHTRATLRCDIRRQMFARGSKTDRDFNLSNGWKPEQAARRCCGATAVAKSTGPAAFAGTRSAHAYSTGMGSEVEDLRDHAERCRRLALVAEAERNRRQLLELAFQLDKQADELERKATPSNDQVRLRSGCS